jgi:hypothetical protein
MADENGTSSILPAVKLTMDELDMIQRGERAWTQVETFVKIGGGTERDLVMALEADAGALLLAAEMIRNRIS